MQHVMQDIGRSFLTVLDRVGRNQQMWLQQTGLQQLRGRNIATITRARMCTLTFEFACMNQNSREFYGDVTRL
jgi:hypothetical protein